MITSDQSLPFQQNLAGRAFGLVIPPSNDLSSLVLNLDAIAAAMGTVQAGSFVRVA